MAKSISFQESPAAVKSPTKQQPLNLVAEEVEKQMKSYESAPVLRDSKPSPVSKFAENIKTLNILEEVKAYELNLDMMPELTDLTTPQDMLKAFNQLIKTMTV
jgi:hypothetical protein